eukprot:365337-Chlamydomonas_euryale.AAC.7
MNARAGRGGAGNPGSTAALAPRGSNARAMEIASGAGPRSPLQLLLSSDGEFLRGIVLDEAAKGIDAAWRLAFDALFDSVRGPPPSIARALSGSSAVPTRARRGGGGGWSAWEVPQAQAAAGFPWPPQPMWPLPGLAPTGFAPLWGGSATSPAGTSPDLQAASVGSAKAASARSAAGWPAPASASMTATSAWPADGSAAGPSLLSAAAGAAAARGASSGASLPSPLAAVLLLVPRLSEAKDAEQVGVEVCRCGSVEVGVMWGGMEQVGVGEWLSEARYAEQVGVEVWRWGPVGVDVVQVNVIVGGGGVARVWSCRGAVAQARHGACGARAMRWIGCGLVEVWEGGVLLS